MAVYFTNSMSSNFDTRRKYLYNSINEDECSNDENWRKLMADSNKKVQLSKDMICRVCAGSGCTPLSDKIDELDIMGALRSSANITIEPDDALPKYICTKCLENLKVSLTFKRNCEAADKKFRKILNPMGDPSFHSYPYSKHDFQLILHQMKLKRMKVEEKCAQERKRREKMIQKKLPKVKQFRCSPCDLVFQNKEKLMGHRRERQCMRRACDICGQLVLSIAQHMRHIHKQAVPHRCNICGKEFPIIARLKNHMVVHTNTFNFFCDLCPYKCKHKYYLVMHMRTHTGEKPYKCPQCPAAFVNPSNMNKHKLTHQEKQFKCVICDKAFRTNSSLREHHEASHLNIKHSCNLCGRDFCYKSDLRKHEVRTHNRTKRDYIGGEPTYKQVERLHAAPEAGAPDDKWRAPAYLEPPNHALYFTDVAPLMHQPQQMVQQQTVQLTLPELTLKKDEVKMYEQQQSIGYF